MTKRRSPDWLQLAMAATDARDHLRRALPTLSNLAASAGTPDATKALVDVRATVVAAVHRLRFALKVRPGGKS